MRLALSLLLVAAVIILLMSPGGLKLLPPSGEALVAEAKHDLSVLADCVSLFRAKHGRLPRDLSEASHELVGSELRLDPWGRPYALRAGSSGIYRVVSFGRDGREGGEGLDADLFALTRDARSDPLALTSGATGRKRR